MPLNSSGPISLAGATAGQSIAVELGQSATGQISLNDANVRALAGVPSGAITMPTNFWGKSLISNFFTYSNQAISQDDGPIVTTSFNPSRRAVTTSYLRPVPLGQGEFMYSTVFTDTGSVVASRQLFINSGGVLNVSSNYRMNVVCDDGSFYVVFAQLNQPVVSTWSATVARYNASGVLQWQRAYGDSVGRIIIGAPVTDASNNLYLWVDSRTLIKIDSSGNFLWGRSFASLNTNPRTFCISPDRTRLLAVSQLSATTNCVVFDTDGNPLRAFNITTSGAVNGAFITNSGTIYVSTVAASGPEVGKINSSNVFDWRVAFSGVLSSVSQGVSITPDENFVYFVFSRQLPYTTGNPAILPNYVTVKLSSSGVVQWQRLRQGPVASQRFWVSVGGNAGPYTGPFVDNAGNITMSDPAWVFTPGGTQYGGLVVTRPVIGLSLYTDAQLVANSKTYTILNSTVISTITQTFGSATPVMTIGALALPTSTPVTLSVRVTTFAESAGPFTFVTVT